MPNRLPRIAINGFGRIGRALARIALADTTPTFDIVAINDLSSPDSLRYLLQYDSTHRKLRDRVDLVDGVLKVGRLNMRIVREADPAKLPWAELGVDVVVESTGRFRTRTAAAGHLVAGARRVVLSAPGDGKDAPDATVVYGINHGDVKPEHTVISAASCTTTCLAPVAKALDEAFGLVCGTMTTVHSYTNDQVVLDVVHKDWRRGRACAQNIIPSSTGAAKAIGLVLPQLAGKLQGGAMRVPTADVSLIDLVVVSRETATVETINAALRGAAESLLPGTLRIEDDPVVSSDLIGDPTGSIVDSELTSVVGGNLIKVVSWYDNEWGYANRLYALLEALAS